MIAIAYIGEGAKSGLWVSVCINTYRCKHAVMNQDYAAVFVKGSGSSIAPLDRVKLNPAPEPADSPSMQAASRCAPCSRRVAKCETRRDPSRGTFIESGNIFLQSSSVYSGAARVLLESAGTVRCNLLQG